MAKIAIIGCKRIQDQLCIACEKCLKAISKKDGEFARHQDDDIELVALGHCGDCPGLVLPKVQLMNEIGSTIDRKFDTIHFGTCILKAQKSGDCPLDLEKLSGLIKENFGKETVIGTHNY
jgi:predicted metal-binding protein